MTLEQLRIFVAVAERQHVTRAAEALHLAQSAVSAAVSGLEGRHGAKLFHRVGRGIALTEAGTVFLVEARAVLARAAAAELALAELGGLKRGTLSVMASQTIASYWLPRHLVAFRRRHPGINIRLTVGNTAQVASAVHAGTADLGFVEGAYDDPLLVGRTVARDQLIIVVAPDHPWARLEALEPGLLAESEWVLREPGSGTRSVFEAARRDPRARLRKASGRDGTPLERGRAGRRRSWARRHGDFGLRGGPEPRKPACSCTWPWPCPNATSRPSGIRSAPAAAPPMRCSP